VGFVTVGATTRSPGKASTELEAPVDVAQAPVREPITELSTTYAQVWATPSGVALDTQIPTLFSAGTEVSVGVENWSPRAQEFDKTKTVVHDRWDYDDYDNYHDENVNPYADKMSVGHPSYSDRPQYNVHRPPVSSPVMPYVFDRPRAFRSVSQGHWDMPCESPRSRESRPKSRGSSRTASRASGSHLDWLGDFMKKYADDASSGEARMVEEARQRESEARQREKDLRSMALEREKEIRADMKQLAASEARVAVLEKQLKDKAYPPPNSRGDTFVRRERTYCPDYNTQARQIPWCPPPVISETDPFHVPSGAPTSYWYNVGFTSPQSLSEDTSYAGISMSVCHEMSLDTITVSVVKPRASITTFGGPQQSSMGPMCPTVQLPTTVSATTLSSINLVPATTLYPPQGLATPVVSTGLEGSMSTLSFFNPSLGTIQSQAMPVVSSSLLPTAAMTGPGPVFVNSSVSTPLVGTTALVVPPTGTIIPPVSLATLPQSGTISNLAPSVVTTPSASISTSVAPSCVASSLPVGTSVSSSLA